MKQVLSFSNLLLQFYKRTCPLQKLIKSLISRSCLQKLSSPRTYAFSQMNILSCQKNDSPLLSQSLRSKKFFEFSRPPIKNNTVATYPTLSTSALHTHHTKKGPQLSRAAVSGHKEPRSVCRGPTNPSDGCENERKA